MATTATNGHARTIAKVEIRNSKTNGKLTTLPPVDLTQVAKIGMQAYRAPSLLQPHRAREALADAHAGRIPPLIGYFLGLSCPPVAKVVAQLGFDVMWIDWEHASTNTETMTQMVHDIQCLSEGKTMAFVRVKGHDHASIGYALDAGASIVVPQVDTVEQARHIVSAAKFGASINGTRSAPPVRFLPGISDTLIHPSLSLHQNLNRQAAVVIQIESLEGINNLDDILTEVGEQIDSVWLGSLDLRVNMELTGFWGQEPEFVEAIKKYERTLNRHNMPASGLVMGTPEERSVVARGRSFMCVGADVYALMAEMKTLGEVRRDFPAQSYEGVYGEK